MPRYDFVCDECEIIWEETRRMKDSDAPSECSTCGGEGRRVWEASGMIKVEGGASPTRYGKGGYSTQPRADDPGFVKEFEQIYEDDPIANPNTGEQYKFTEDPDTGQKYAELPSREKQNKNQRQFLANHTKYRRETPKVYREMMARVRDNFE